MDKSYVSMEKKICIVCGHEYETNGILLDNRLKDSLNRYTITGFGFCKEHKELKDKGYIAFIGIDESKTEIVNDLIKPENAYRTGKLAFIKRHAFEKMFSGVRDRDGIIFVDDMVIDKLSNMVKK